MTTVIETIVAFVEGKMDVKSFERLLYQSQDIEDLLTAADAPQYAHTETTLFHYLIAINYQDFSSVLNAHDSLAQFLSQRNISVTPSTKLAEQHHLLLSAQPKWLDIRGEYAQQLLNAAPDILNKKELKEWLKNEILKQFQYVSNPPRWLQTPEWPIQNQQPLVFLGQLSIENYFYDEAAVYIFYNPQSKECTSLIQKC